MRFGLVLLLLSTSAWAGKITSQASTNLGVGVDASTYGVKCDGSTDDLAALQRAINAGPGTVNVQSGTCKLSGALVLGEKQVQLIGSGSEATILKCYGSGTCIDLTHVNNGGSAGNVFERGTRISDLKILANGSKVVGTIGIKATDVIEVAVTNVIITGFQYGISLHPTVQELYLEHVKVDYSTMALRVVDANQLVMNNFMCNFDDQCADFSGAQVVRWFGGLVQSSSTSPGIVHTGSVSSAMLLQGLWFENNYTPMIQINPSIALTGFSITDCRFTYSSGSTGTETFIDLANIQGGSITNSRFFYSAGQKLLKVRTSSNIVSYGNDFNTNASSSNLDVDDLSQVMWFGGPGAPKAVGIGKLPLSTKSFWTDTADVTTLTAGALTLSTAGYSLAFGQTGGAFISSATTATAGDDVGFHFKTVNALSTDNNTGTECLMRLANATDTIYCLKPGGRFMMLPSASNLQAGFYVQNPNGSGIFLKTAGGSGEIFALEAITSASTTLNIGLKNSSGTVSIGPTEASGTAELVLTNTSATFRSGMSLLVGTNPVPVKVSVPSTAGTTCTTGQIAFDTSFAYYCAGTNTWVRSAVATW